MSALAFTITGASPAPQMAAPAIVFRLRIDVLDGAPIHAIALRCLTRIEARRRRYSAEEAARLYELFGAPTQWERTLQSVTWTQTSVIVPSFDRVIEVDMTLPCTYDLEVASAKYLHAIRSGAIPIVCLFSGMVFRGGGAFTIEPIAWDLEATFPMPCAVWEATMNRFFPGEGWVRLQRETLDRLQAFRGKHAVVSWDDALTLLLQRAEASQQTV